MTAPALRRVRPGDWLALNALHRWAWFPERSERGWAWLQRMGDAHPGWVLEDQDGVCGCLGNIRQAYALGSESLVAATGYSLIVLPRAKGSSRALLNAFQAQPGVFATSILNANARSAPVYERQGFKPFPAVWSDAKIVWPLAPLVIASERAARSILRRRRPRRELFATGPRSPVEAFDRHIALLDPWRDAGAIDRFWSLLRASEGLVACRSARVFQDRFSDPDRAADPVLLGWFDEDRITAIAMGQLGKMSECEAAILDVIDLAWVGGDGRSAASALLSQMKRIGRGLGASRLRLPIVNGDLAAIAANVPGSIVRRRHVHGHIDLRLAADLVAGWRPTAFDGDFGFCLRPPPAPGSSRTRPGPRTEEILLAS